MSKAMKINYFRTLVTLTAALSLCLLTLVSIQPAEAAFPGKNGKIVFWSDRSAGPGLYTIIPGGTATKIPGTSGGDNAAAWSPDGSQIAFQSTDATSATNKEISVMNADGSGRRQLTATPVAEQEPTWSPDGSRIAFAAGTSGTDATTDLEIWVMNADGSGLMQLTNTADGVRDTQPAWSPLGDQIAFVSEGRTGDTNSNIYVMDTDPATDDAINLTPNDTTINPVYQWNDEDPSWSPDGTQITYSTVQDVWTMNADGTGKTNLTLGNGGGAQPAWSPDGGSIVYQRSDGTDRNIYVMDNNGDNKTPIDTTLRKDEKPDWQQDSIPPQTAITSGPSGATNSTSASFSFVSSETGSTFRCSLDGAAFTACSSPKSYSGLTDGSHTLSVRATDVAGNVDSTPASRAWTVETVAPTGTVKINGGAAYTRSTSVKLSLSATDPSPGSGVSSMRFSNDGSRWSAWQSYATNKSWTLAGGNGIRTVHVQYKDKAGNVSTTARDTIKLDTAKPTISGMSPKHKSVIKDRTPTIKATVRDNMTNLSKGNIRLYVAGKAIPAAKFSYSAATDRLVYNSPKLSKGKKTVKIVATDTAKNVGVRSWFFTIR